MNRRAFCTALIGTPAVAVAACVAKPITIYYDPWCERLYADRLAKRGFDLVEVRLTKRTAEELAGQLPEINRNRASVGLGPLFDLPNGWTSR